MGTHREGEAVEADGPALRVLLVDDDADFRLILRARLNLLPGIEVVATAGDADEAIAGAARTAPDAVVVDLLMPGVDGYATLARLRDEHPSLGLVAYTAVTGPAARERVAALGAELVQKTREPAGLVAALQRCVTTTAAGSPGSST